MVSWFNGAVGEAIQEARRKHVLFVVAIDSPSPVVKSRLDSCHQLSSKMCNSINVYLEAESENRRHFCQLYPVSALPAVVIIDADTGKRMEALEGAEWDEQQLLEAFEKAEESKDRPKVCPQSPKTEGNEDNEESNGCNNGAEAEIGNGDGKEERSGGSGEAGALTLEERVAKAKQMMAERRNQREQQSQLAEDRSEATRRSAGRALHEFKRMQEEQSVKDAAEERRREKEETQRARERVKAQIEEDRRNRAARFEEEQRRRAEETKMNRAQEDEKEEEKAPRGSEARVQFRLPDGSSYSRRFAADSQLEVLYECVHTELGVSNFSLTTTFPRQELDFMPRSTSLVEVGVVPSGTVLVLAKTSVVSSNFSFDQFMQHVMLPFLFFWRLLLSLFGSGAAAGDASTSNATAVSEPTVGASSGSNHPSDSVDRETLRRRRQGNITRLGDLSSGDDNDENNTWNGNSTQQM